jgi:hypothetical protein
MTINISPDPRLQFFGNDGKPLVGGKLYTYEAGTTTPLVTYTNYLGTTPNSNPVILDSRGEASVWLGNGTRYKFVLKDANNVEIWTQDYLVAGVGADGAGAYGTWPISISGNAATATSVSGGYVQSITAGTNITIGGTATNPVINAASAGGTVTSVSGAGQYGFSLTGGPITGSGTLTVTPPTPSTSGNVLMSDGTNWTSQTFIGPSTFLGVGTYAWLIYQAGPAISAGQVISGSLLVYSPDGSGSTTTVSGSWKNMDSGQLAGDPSVKLVLRVA